MVTFERMILLDTQEVTDSSYVEPTTPLLISKELWELRFIAFAYSLPQLRQDCVKTLSFFGFSGLRP
jgi:hypothetical protein